MQIYRILKEEDRLLSQQMGAGSIGECMEFAIRTNLIMEVVTMAQTDQPPGMFTVCLDFFIDLATKIKGMPVIHNDKVHRSILQLAKCIEHSIKSDIQDVNDPNELS